METHTIESFSGVAARWWHALPDGRIQCDLCPRDCRLHEGQRAACFVRGMRDGKMLLTTYGRSSGFCIDPIEKKPLNHFLPGSRVLSFGTAGCNLACKFCQNWDISKSRDMDRLLDSAPPETIARAAQEHGAASVAFTYNDPVIFAEYALDTASACRALGIRTVAVTAGYLHREPAREFFAAMDAANIDLKAFSDEFYVKLCGGKLQPVLDCIALAHHETNCWIELTTLLIPGRNDTDDELRALTRWVSRELGADVPLHFTAFHPDWKLNDLPSTPLTTLRRARDIGLEAGLHFVYTGNLPDPEGTTTYCPACRSPLIERRGYRIARYGIDADSRCAACGQQIPGQFVPAPVFGDGHREPIRLNRIISSP